MIHSRFLATAMLLALFASTAHAQRTATTSHLAVETANPMVRVMTQNPKEINIGKPATFVMTVINEGKTPAQGVIVETSIPQHAELTSATPKPLKVDGLKHTFQIGDLAPNTSKKITLVTVPRKVALIHVASTVTFATSTQSSIVVREPKLAVSARITPEVVIGTKADWMVRVTNTGDGPADNVVLTPALKEGALQGSPLAQPVKVGLLKAGESKDVKFSIVPTKRGKVAGHFVTTNSDGLKAEGDSNFKVLQAEMVVVTKGPHVQPMGRAGTYEILLSNNGDAATGRAFVTVKLPAGLEVTSAPENAWDEETRSLRWRITTLRPSDKVTLRFEAETNTEGVQLMAVTAEAEHEWTKTAAVQHTTRVISRPNPIVTVLNDQEYTPVGSPIAFKVQVVNAGSKVADKLRVRVAIPDGLKPVNMEGYKLVDNMIEFPLQKVESGDKITLPFYAVGTKAGEHRVKVLLDGVALSRELSFEGSAFCYSEVEEKTEEQANDTGTTQQTAGAE